MYTWQSEKIDLREGIFLLQKSEEQESHYVSGGSAVLGRTLVQKIFSRSEKYFELCPNIELKLPLKMRKASLEITKALVFQTLLYSTLRFLFWGLKG